MFKNKYLYVIILSWKRNNYKGSVLMKYKFISDSHIHSKNSFDGHDSAIMMCERAANLGLYSVTITDHCECNEYYGNDENIDYRKAIENSIKDTSKARAMYMDRVNVYTGIELGQPYQNMRAAEEVLSLADYDFVIGSLHNLRDERDFYFLEYTPQNAPILLDRYFAELTELAELNCFDSLAHLTYPMRYISAYPDITANINYFKNELDKVLSTLAKNDKALEVNTSGLRQKIGKTLPDEDVIKRFRELGGKYVTIGSDAHRWGDLGSGIEEGLQLLLKCGFTHFTVYEKRCPKLLPIL